MLFSYVFMISPWIRGFGFGADLAFLAVVRRSLEAKEQVCTVHQPLPSDSVDGNGTTTTWEIHVEKTISNWKNIWKNNIVIYVSIYLSTYLSIYYDYHYCYCYYYHYQCHCQYRYSYYHCLLLLLLVLLLLLWLLYIYNFKTNFTIMDVDNRLTSTWRHGVTWPRQLHTSQLFLVGPFRCWLRTKQHSQACELNHHLAHGPKMSKN